MYSSPASALTHGYDYCYGHSIDHHYPLHTSAPVYYQPMPMQPQPLMMIPIVPFPVMQQPLMVPRQLPMPHYAAPFAPDMISPIIGSSNEYLTQSSDSDSEESLYPATSQSSSQTYSNASDLDADTAFLSAPSTPGSYVRGGTTYFMHSSPSSNDGDAEENVCQEEKDNDHIISPNIEDFEEEVASTPSTPPHYEHRGCTFYIPSPSSAPDFEDVEGQEDVADEDYVEREGEECDGAEPASDCLTPDNEEVEEHFLPTTPLSRRPLSYKRGGCTFYSPSASSDSESDDVDVDVEEEFSLDPVQELLLPSSLLPALLSLRPEEQRDCNEAALNEDEANAIYFASLSRPDGEDPFEFTEEEIDDLVSNQLRMFFESSSSSTSILV